MVSVLLIPLRLILWPRMRSFLVNVPWLERIYILLCVRWGVP